MIVVDASAIVELLARRPSSAAVADRILNAKALHAPHLLDIEVMQVLRRMVAMQVMSPAQAGMSIDYFGDLLIERHEHGPLLQRIWDLRGSLSAYDAAYVALAEAMQAPLLTCDAKLSRAGGHRAAIDLMRV